MKQKKTKICIIGGQRFSYPLDTTSEKKFRALQAAGEIFIIAFSKNITPRRFQQYGKFYLLPLLPVALLRYLEFWFCTSLILLKLIFKDKIDIIHSQDPYQALSAILAKKIAYLCNKKIIVIIDCHGDIEESLFMQRKIYFTSVYRIFMKLVAKFTLNNADSLRCVSKFTKKQLKKLSPHKTVCQFSAWTDIDTFLNVNHLNLYSLLQSHKNILFVGSIIPQKGIHFLIKAFSNIKKTEAKLQLIGDIVNKKYYKKITKMTNRLEINNKVRFILPVPQQKLAEYMANAIVLVLPSVSEAFGRVIIESMACGTPVIGSNTGGIAELVKDYENGFLIPPGDINALSEKLEWILAHPKKTQEMGQKGKFFVANNFSNQFYIQNYCKMIDDIILKNS